MPGSSEMNRMSGLTFRGEKPTPSKGTGYHLQSEPSRPEFGKELTMYDAIVVGARCAGSPTAMLLARKGYRVLLLDKAGFPSDTLSTHYIHQPGVARLKRWGVLDKVVASNCPPTRQLTLDVG